jgi:metal-responsive CopG/Arc/MetJ family transcriptional regulator
MAPARAVQISIDEELLARIDEDPEARLHGRSAFVRSALRRYLQAKERARIDDALRAAYGGRADEALADIEPLIESQAWPEE